MNYIPPRILPGDPPLTEEPENSGLEIALDLATGPDFFSA